MASIISKRPLVGIAAGAIFAALGLLLVDVAGPERGITGVLGTLYAVVGSFFVFVAGLSILFALATIWSAYWSRNRH